MTNEIKNAVSDEAFQQYVDKAVEVTRKVEVSQLQWYWRMGEILSNFVADAKDKKICGRSVADFAKTMAERGFEFGVSTLYAAQAIFRRFQYDAIEVMITQGVRIGHLKTMLPFYEKPEFKELMKLLRTPEGKVISIEDLRRACTELARKSALLTASHSAARTGHADEPRTQVEGERTVELVDSTTDGDSELFGDDDGKASTPKGSPDAAVDAGHDSAKPKGDSDGKTASRGLTKEKEYANSPLKTLKGFDNAITKLTALMSDMFILVDELTKIGFNHEPTQRSVQKEYASVLAGVTNLQEPLNALRERMIENKDAF